MYSKGVFSKEHRPATGMDVKAAASRSRQRHEMAANCFSQNS